jgi:hypothetical protein
MAIRVCPKIFADRDADLVSSDDERINAGRGLEVACLIEDVVVRDEGLIDDASNFATLKIVGRVKERLADAGISSNGANEDRQVWDRLGYNFESRGSRILEAFSKQQVPRAVSNQGKFWKQGDIRSSFGCTPCEFDDPISISRKVPRYGVDLTDGDFERR